MRINVLGVGFDVVTFDKAVEKAKAFAKGEKPAVIYTPNPEMVMAARKDAEFLRVLNTADMVVPDGIGIVYASRILKPSLPERVGGYDLTLKILEHAAKDGLRVYFFGSAPGVAESAAEKLKAKFAGLNIVGLHSGYFNNNEESRIIEDINAAGTDILLVGLGFPKQEKWIAENKEKLCAKVLIGVGGSLDGYAGTVKRAPNFFIKLNLEWFYRLVQQPSRIKRQIQLPLFMLAVIREKIRGTHE
ncbi:acetylglucosaminyldiphosphoundecaprenol acetyl-beta-D-mannosaminyltransferase [Clostridia bacterium]|nr:acetylglucosaminyldiphosphoundecaprenol acetyl-beta-D-mannosaminyltransferase [Clostridia bacterium]